VTNSCRIITYRGVAIRHFGQVDYEPCLDAMREFTAAREDDTEDEIWIVEHPPVYTLGLAGKREHLLRETTIPVIKTDRGGQITYHGPGQLILYPLVNLRRRKINVRQMVRMIEQSVVHWLASLGVVAYGSSERPGVYVTIADTETKMASLGLKIKNGCSYHGVSVNLTVSLDPFLNINPCGYPGMPMTRLKDLIADDLLPSFDEAGEALAKHLIDLITI
jgi:lipoyl(octanoyl) transferase